jgi:transcriptional regulator with XRE-family HTH domain
MTPIGLNVKRLREAAGMTQQALATAAGLSLSIVAQIEQGKNADPRGSTLMALANALGATVDELLRSGTGAKGKK